MHLCIHNVAKMFLSTAFWAHHTITMASMWDDMQSTEVSLMLVVATRIKWPTIMKTASTHNDTLQLPSLFTVLHVIWGALDASLSPNAMVVIFLGRSSLSTARRWLCIFAGYVYQETTERNYFEPAVHQRHPTIAFPFQLAHTTSIATKKLLG